MFANKTWPCDRHWLHTYLYINLSYHHGHDRKVKAIVQVNYTKLFCSYIMARTSYIKWNDYEVRFVLDQHADLNFCRASSQKRHSSGRHVAPFGHIVQIPRQTICVLTLGASRRSSKYHFYNICFEQMVTRTHYLPHSIRLNNHLT